MGTDGELLDVLKQKGWRIDMFAGRNWQATLTRDIRVMPNITVIHDSPCRDFDLKLDNGVACAVRIVMRDQSVGAAVALIETLICSALPHQITTHEDRIKEILVDELGVDRAEIRPAARLVEDLGCDSLDAVEIIMQIEDAFPVLTEIPLDEIDKMQTVADVYRYINDNVPANT